MFVLFALCCCSTSRVYLSFLILIFIHFVCYLWLDNKYILYSYHAWTHEECATSQTAKLYARWCVPPHSLTPSLLPSSFLLLFPLVVLPLFLEFLYFIQKKRKRKILFSCFTDVLYRVIFVHPLDSAQISHTISIMVIQWWRSYCSLYLYLNPFPSLLSPAPPSLPSPLSPLSLPSPPLSPSSPLSCSCVVGTRIVAWNHLYPINFLDLNYIQRKKERDKKGW